MSLKFKPSRLMLHATTTTVQYLRTDICLRSEFWGPQNAVDIDFKNSIWMFTICSLLIIQTVLHTVIF